MPDNSSMALMSYRLKKATPGKPVMGSYGGHPRGVPAADWPYCAVCKSPMCHMAQVNAGPWLDLGPWARLSVFICHATGGQCEDWDPIKGANRVVLHRTLDNTLYDGPPTVRVYRRVNLTVDPPINETQLMQQVRNRKRSLKQALDQLRHDKLGGQPVWLHGDATPLTKSNESMQFAVQLTRQLVRFDITRKGVAYVFYDAQDASEHAAKLLWQGG